MVIAPHKEPQVWLLRHVKKNQLYGPCVTFRTGCMMGSCFHSMEAGTHHKRNHPTRGNSNCHVSLFNYNTSLIFPTRGNSSYNTSLILLTRRNSNYTTSFNSFDTL